MKCKVCGRRFNPEKAHKYEIVRSNGLSGAILGNALTRHEAFDCPKCGCQNVVNLREISVEEYMKNKKSKEEKETV